MTSKKWYASRLLWLSILAIVGGVAEFLSGLPAGASITTIIGGILGVIFRVTTNQAIAGTPSAKPK